MTVLEKLNSIKNQEITAKENVENYIKVIEEKNDDINSFLEINKEEALAKAEDIDARIKAGEEVGALAGLVFGIKANINVEDFIISAASKTLEDYIGSYDATVVKRIKAEDGIIIGINNMDEFAAGSSCETSYYGPVNNPAAPGRIPGGSSGGSAAAVAAEMCDIAIGSDTGGSIRNPSSHCGVLGFKSTYGAVSRQGLLDLSMSLDQIGPMANDITGITLALDTIVGYDRTECTTLKWEAPNFTEVALSIEGEKPLEGMKIATVKEFREVTDDTINEKIDEAIAKLEALGAEVTFGNLLKATVYAGRLAPGTVVGAYRHSGKWDGRRTSGVDVWRNGELTGTDTDPSSFQAINIQYAPKEHGLFGGAGYYHIKDDDLVGATKVINGKTYSAGSYTYDGTSVEDTADIWSVNAGYKFSNKAQLWGSFAQNTKADVERDSWQALFKYGTIYCGGNQNTKKGEWAVWTGYKKYGSNASLWGVNFDDVYAGTHGVVVGASYAPMDRVVMLAKYFKGEYITGDGDVERLFGRVEFFY